MKAIFMGTPYSLEATGQQIVSDMAKLQNDVDRLRA